MQAGRPLKARRWLEWGCSYVTDNAPSFTDPLMRSRGSNFIVGDILRTEALASHVQAVFAVHSCCISIPLLEWSRPLASPLLTLNSISFEAIEMVQEKKLH